jgi:hypothetical protein
MGYPMLGWTIFILWLAGWFEIARRFRKATGSWIIAIGGGFMAALIAFGVISVVVAGVFSVFSDNPNPKTRNWEVSKPPAQDDFWGRGQPDSQSILDPYGKPSKSRPSANRVIVEAREYGDKWSFTVPGGELECISNAVIMHTVKGTYSINGKAMGRYAGTLPEWREIAKPYPGLENDPRAKMPPPTGLIKRGLALCK